MITEQFNFKSLYIDFPNWTKKEFDLVDGERARIMYMFKMFPLTMKEKTRLMDESIRGALGI